ncbi:MAG: 3-hydroxyacyl-CoA dehydrogenase NAD-binding domain-containing protein [Rhodocyclaceae bacterium]|nr:3-hydroxyacyl-CoA dehydrogenase NAD-binding domain-containing protein [Rhodocyclaceae bacterium]
MISTRLQGSVAILTIDMPGRTMNALGADFAGHFVPAFEAAVADANITGIVITSGKPSFIAGADLAQMAGLAASGVTPADALAHIAVFGDVFRRIETCGKPVVAAATGTALGGGLELMLACHYRIAADAPAARFGLPEVKLGLLPGAGGTQRVPRLIGLAASIPLLTQGTELTAAAAQKAGLIHEVVAAEQLIDAALRALADGRVKAVAAWDEKGFRLPGGDAYTAANQNTLMAANAGLHAATRGNYPAPLAIMRCIYEGSKLPMDKALKLEQKHFVTLVQGRVAQNMIRTLFFAKQAADKLVRRPAGVPASKVNKLGILGSGFMGAGIAQVSALAGIDVVLLDREQAIAEKGRAGIAQALEADVQKGRLAADKRDAALARIVAAGSYEAFADCDLVIEAVIEDFGIKAIVTKAAEAAMGKEAIFASNTSALPINDLAKVSLRPQNFIGLHFFSPVPKMALVEVIVGKDTTPETLARALDYIRQIRKTPIVVNDGYGFYTTRCVDAYVREGMRLLLDGVDPVLIENAGTALGMPVGPLSLGDEVGLDVMHHITHFFRGKEQGAWADDRHQRVNALMDRLSGERRFGRKTGAGFYAYPAGAAKHLDRAAIAAFAPPADVQPSSGQIRERLLYAQLVEAARCWADGVATEAGEIDLGAVLAWAFPTWLGGPAAAIDDIGMTAFVARCDTLCSELGPRFSLPQTFRDAAASGFRFHS